MRVAIIALMLTVATQAEAECDNLCVLRKDRCKAAAAILPVVGLVAGVGVAATVTACQKKMLHLRAHSFSVNPKLMTKLSTIPNHQLSIACGVCKHHMLLEIANRIAVVGATPQHMRHAREPDLITAV